MKNRKLKSKIVRISAPAGKMKVILLQPGQQKEPLPGILWIHGGGYLTGMSEMVFFSCGKLLAERYGAVVMSPEYRLSWKAKYPAALQDCYAALQYMYHHANELGIRRDCLIVGGESAGGGLAAALCLYARDRGEIPIAMQLPLYPMLDCNDTETSKDNHGRVWNTRKNHRGWAMYLGNLYGTKNIPNYASAARETDYRNLPPAYTFVCEGEPFLAETLTYVRKLRSAGVPAAVDIYPGNMHAFDLLRPRSPSAKKAKRRLCRMYEKMLREIVRP